MPTQTAKEEVEMDVVTTTDPVDIPAVPAIPEVPAVPALPEADSAVPPTDGANDDDVDMATTADVNADSTVDETPLAAPAENEATGDAMAVNTELEAAAPVDDAAPAEAAATDNTENNNNDDNNDDNNKSSKSPSIRGRKSELTCRCVKSKCLKLYCDCFRRNKLCDGACECSDCKNTEAESGPDGERTATMLQILKKNPHAFDNPKFGLEEGKRSGEIDELKEKIGVGGLGGVAPRGRGRPRTKSTGKTTTSRVAKSASAAAGSTGKRPRGRPRKSVDADADADASSTAAKTPVAKKRRTRSSARLSAAPANLEEDPDLKLTDEDPIPVPFTLEEYPDLEIDETEDHSKLVHAFKEPLFPKDCSEILSIAYSHHTASKAEREKIRKKKKEILDDVQRLRDEFYAKKAELLQANALLKQNSQKVGRWTRKVFDLELKEPCTWNTKLEKLKEYVHINGGPPEHIKKTKGDENEKAIVTWITGMKIKVKKGHNSIKKYPHRKDALEELGVHWENENEARFETMFQKLMDYKKEHGTLRMPSLDLCKESGDQELVQLHNWVFSQVGSMRYQLKNKKPEMVKRFLDVGFSFEKWYGTNGHVFDREIKSFDEIARKYVESGGKILDGKDAEGEGNEEEKDDKEKSEEEEGKSENGGDKKEDAKEEGEKKVDVVSFLAKDDEDEALPVEGKGDEMAVEEGNDAAADVKDNADSPELANDAADLANDENTEDAPQVTDEGAAVKEEDTMQIEPVATENVATDTAIAETDANTATMEV